VEGEKRNRGTEIGVVSPYCYFNIGLLGFFGLNFGAGWTNEPEEEDCGD
jgi:hypothetical protein